MTPSEKKLRDEIADLVKELENLNGSSEPLIEVIEPSFYIRGRVQKEIYGMVYRKTQRHIGK